MSDNVLDPRDSGPDRLFDVTEAGRAWFWLAFVICVAVALVVAFFATTAQ